MFISELSKSLDKRKIPEFRDFSRVDMASPARFERATFRLGGERSILLSYGDTVLLTKAIIHAQDPLCPVFQSVIG